LAYVYLGERFGKWPWEIEAQPADRVLFYMSIMSEEADMLSLLDGLSPDDELYETEDIDDA